ncbi:hypothetical protein [Chitinivorax sp. B]|uniref:hypothetical protein n=1 Tax=Chitinivorax sp. B TaxID=2502235 RepID=UPI0010F458F6|nr:hypothetical protein [Chitinivorax sp. B]
MAEDLKLLEQQILPTKMPRHAHHVSIEVLNKGIRTQRVGVSLTQIIPNAILINEISITAISCLWVHQDENPGTYPSPPLSLTLPAGYTCERGLRAEAWIKPGY